MLITIRKAQSTLEYALLIGVVVGALLSMQNYLKRSYQGKLQQVGDQIGDPYSPGHTKRTEEMNMTIASIQENTTQGVNGSTTTTITSQVQNQTMVRTVANLSTEDWPE
ncbi:MAG: hypothetical protein PHQ96_04060 [Candidatus Omnitrophica bacterium]|nr:hypothetical protein [Candidatus Omnitrophota bacterium]